MNLNKMQVVFSDGKTYTFVRLSGKQVEGRDETGKISSCPLFEIRLKGSNWVPLKAKNGKIGISLYNKIYFITEHAIERGIERNLFSERADALGFFYLALKKGVKFINEKDLNESSNKDVMNESDRIYSKESKCVLVVSYEHIVTCYSYQGTILKMRPEYSSFQKQKHKQLDFDSKKVA